MAVSKDKSSKLYYFFDIDLGSRLVVGWGIENREQVEIELTEGYHRLFVSKGQYNKLVAKLEAARN